ncbi:hypothetical protein K402DRAFT_388627 [Aulographum hederae CBS 113979]|uniref:Symplekin/Pta1 N-terminal domain-containing protein n=1 Tax=Aulographum hederae CBS 113979 TaxID=1176131 RepID=A0A6G1HFW9_9PEZI|nr:hypothetical protein K402DRAFT_388627 [Aulographum hederae CBS 113979]
MAASSQIAETLKQLKSARLIVLTDPNAYLQILPGILPMVGAGAALDLRRWGSDFIAEAFASPAVPFDIKQKLVTSVLPVLKGYFETPDEDTGVIKTAVQTAASVYQFAFRYTINNPLDSQTWQTMSAIKSSILSRVDVVPSGVRICCIKFLQVVVLAQTPGVISDPRVPSRNEVSLSLVPRDHPLIPPINLQAEATGFLDRLLGILQESTSDALLVTATLNSLGGLIRARPSVVNKIVNALLNFNPLKLMNAPMTPKNMVMIKSMWKTTKAVLNNVNARFPPTHPLHERIKAHNKELDNTITKAPAAGKKRAAPDTDEPTDGLDHAKRQRLGADVPEPPAAPPKDLTTGEVSYADLFTLTTNHALQNFDVTEHIPSPENLLRILLPVLLSIDKERMNSAVNTIRARYLALQERQRLERLQQALAAPASKAPVGDDDDEDYEPEYPSEDGKPAIEKTRDVSSADNVADGEVHALDHLGSSSLPFPGLLSRDESKKLNRGYVIKLFNQMEGLPVHGPQAESAGFNRLAGSEYDRESWITMIARIACRSTALDMKDPDVKSGFKRVLDRQSDDDDDALAAIREAMKLYVLQDFRSRLDVAIDWLHEEWLNDRREELIEVPNYSECLIALLDGMLPYYDVRDFKHLLRFLGEIPTVTMDVYERIKNLAKDPERVILATQSLTYICLYRPPSRSLGAHSLKKIFDDFPDAKGAARKALLKVWPQALESEQPPMIDNVAKKDVTA